MKRIARALAAMGILTATLTAVVSAQPPDSTVVAPAAPETPHPIKSVLTRTGEEQDRFEIGGGLVKGFFDAAGSFGYRRFLRQGRIVEVNLMGEMTGMAKDQLTEGAFGAYLLLRPVNSYHESWRLRPLIEGGPAVHAVVQGASLQGLERTRYKAQTYLKGHVYFGVEALLSRKVGLVLRQRFSTPSHRPFDYAQAAILLR
jgi:hypothetical protein